jgi:hypothetical protein
MKSLPDRLDAPDVAVWVDLVARLKALDVQYLSGGSAWEGRASHYPTAQDVPVARLISDLASAQHPRLRDALVALLFRHPEYASTARQVATTLPCESRAHRLIFSSIVAAAALREAWRFTLDIYLPGQPNIEADDISRELGVPVPGEDYGRASLRALSALLACNQPFPFDFARAWEDVADHILDDLKTLVFANWGGTRQVPLVECGC